MAAFATRHDRLAIIDHCRHHILNLTPMAFSRNRGRIGRAVCDLFSLSLSVSILTFERPDADFITVKYDCAAFAGDLESPLKPWRNRSRGLDNSKRPAFEAKTGDKRVFALYM